MPRLAPDRIPWDLLRLLFRWVRRSLFTKPEPDAPYLIVDGTHVELVECLGRQHWGPHWEFSYHYDGEVVNLRRIVYWGPSEHDYVDEDGIPIRWWQTHVRTWDADEDGTIRLRAHWEPAPSEYDEAHLNGVGFDREQGMQVIEATLLSAGIAFERE